MDDDLDYLRHAAQEAAGLLIQHDFRCLTERFGYALAFDRPRALALEEDFRRAAAAWPFEGAEPDIHIKTFAVNDTGLRAVAECMVPAHESGAVLLELVLTGAGASRAVTVEQVTGR
jgi:hypothetical protein